MQSTFIHIFVTILVAITVQCRHVCEETWASFDKRCYYFSSTNGTLKEAMLTCYEIGGHVIEPQDETEEKWIDLQFRLRGMPIFYWIGYSDIQREGEFLSISNARKPTYKNWYREEPNNVNHSEHCAAYSFHHNGWIDVNCQRICNVVCRK